MNLHEVLAEFRRLGGEVTDVRRTGEVRMWHPALRKPVTTNARRKDAPRNAERALRLLQRLQEERRTLT